jgi:hypothetical protein
MPEIACLVLGCLLGIVFLVLAVQWCHSRAIGLGKKHAGYGSQSWWSKGLGEALRDANHFRPPLL